jgi:hypothetical protein
MGKKRLFYCYFTSLSLFQQMGDCASLKVHGQQFDGKRDNKILATRNITFVKLKNALRNTREADKSLVLCKKTASYWIEKIYSTYSLLSSIHL